MYGAFDYEREDSQGDEHRDDTHGGNDASPHIDIWSGTMRDSKGIVIQKSSIQPLLRILICLACERSGSDSGGIDAGHVAILHPGWLETSNAYQLYQWWYRAKTIANKQLQRFGYRLVKAGVRSLRIERAGALGDPSFSLLQSQLHDVLGAASRAISSRPAKAVDLALRALAMFPKSHEAHVTIARCGMLHAGSVPHSVLLRSAAHLVRRVARIKEIIAKFECWIANADESGDWSVLASCFERWNAELRVLSPLYQWCDEVLDTVTQPAGATSPDGAMEDALVHLRTTPWDEALPSTMLHTLCDHIEIQRLFYRWSTSLDYEIDEGVPHQHKQFRRAVLRLARSSRKPIPLEEFLRAAPAMLHMYFEEQLQPKPPGKTKYVKSVIIEDAEDNGNVLKKRGPVSHRPRPQKYDNDDG